jgi:4'-phosphopantetheinyl transferase
VESGLDVWRVDLRRSPGWVAEAARTVLEPEEASRRDRESDDAWRRRLVARAALRMALGRRLDRDPRKLRFAAGPNGKPGLVEAGGAGCPQFNLSHSGDLCVIALSDLGPVGVDVEAVRERAHLERLVETRLAAPEAKQIMRLGGEARVRAFYRVWTRKEAYLKASGIGLGATLDSFAVSAGDPPALLSPLPGDERSWSLHDLELGEGFQGAAAICGRRRDAGPSIRPPEMPMSFLSEWRHSP